MNGDEYQKLSLVLMSVDAIRKQVNEQLDALYMEIASLLPEEEGRGRHKYTLEEMNQMISDACTHRHGPSTRSGPHGNHRTNHHVRKPKQKLVILKK